MVVDTTNVVDLINTIEALHHLTSDLNLTTLPLEGAHLQLTIATRC